MQAVVGSLVVLPDSGEVVQALERIKKLPVEGPIITGDAAFTFAALAKATKDGDGDYFFFVKGNQSELKAELAQCFGDISLSRLSPLKACFPARPRRRPH